MRKCIEAINSGRCASTSKFMGQSGREWGYVEPPGSPRQRTQLLESFCGCATGSFHGCFDRKNQRKLPIPYNMVAFSTASTEKLPWLPRKLPWQREVNYASGGAFTEAMQALGSFHRS